MGPEEVTGTTTSKHKDRCEERFNTQRKQKDQISCMKECEDMLKSMSFSIKETTSKHG